MCMGRVSYGPSLCRPALLWAEFAMGRVCYGPRCPVTTYMMLGNTLELCDAWMSHCSNYSSNLLQHVFEQTFKVTCN